MSSTNLKLYQLLELSINEGIGSKCPLFAMTLQRDSDPVPFLIFSQHLPTSIVLFAYQILKQQRER